jgi:lipoprotein-anchoring transpeptidase ErfK/SrfK
VAVEILGIGAPDSKMIDSGRADGKHGRWMATCIHAIIEEASGTIMTSRVATAMVILVGLSLLPQAASAQVWNGPRPDQNMAADQPGYEPSTQEEELPAEYKMQVVFFRTTEPPGTLVVNTSERFLYLVQGNNRALRYGIGVGREGFQWSGLKRIDRKAEWPDWTPPPEMIERQPYLPRFMAGGSGNPMGARALYIQGTVFRIHGTNQPWTIGSAVSSGCFRLTNPDVTDLYQRVPIGTRVVVLQPPKL